MPTGNLTNYWKEKNSVKINGDWYKLADHVKPQFIKEGDVSYSLGENNEVTFIKSTQNSGGGFKGNNPPTKTPEQVTQPNSTFTTDNRQPKEVKSQRDKDNEERQKSIVNQFCVREGLHALEVYNQNVKDEEKIKPSYETIRNQAMFIKGILGDLAQNDMESKLKEDGDLPDY